MHKKALTREAADDRGADMVAGADDRDRSMTLCNHGTLSN